MKDKHTYGKKMARKGRTKVIYKGTFISDQSLVQDISKNDNFNNHVPNKILDVPAALMCVWTREKIIVKSHWN